MRQLLVATLCAALVSALSVGASNAQSLRVCDAVGLPEGMWVRWTFGDSWAAKESSDGKSSQYKCITGGTGFWNCWKNDDNGQMSSHLLHSPVHAFVSLTLRTVTVDAAVEHPLSVIYSVQCEDR
jgi:hypothetical protein